MPRQKNATKSTKETVIEVLNKARADEIAGILQYMADHYALADADYGAVAANMKLIAKDEMRHAEMFAERIYEIGGIPVAAPSMPAKRGQKITVAIKGAAALEVQAIEDYNGYLAVCRECKESGSVKLFEQIIDEEQIHLSYLENVASHIEELGAVYLAQVAGGPTEVALPGGFIANQGGAA
jgi:bacterioferritin